MKDDDADVNGILVFSLFSKTFGSQGVSKMSPSESLSLGGFVISCTYHQSSRSWHEKVCHSQLREISVIRAILPRGSCFA